MSDFKVLTQMGFSQEHVHNALHATHGKSVSDAIEWLLEHEYRGSAGSSTTSTSKPKAKRQKHRVSSNNYNNRLPTIAEEPSECAPPEEQHTKRYATLLKCTICGKMCQRKIQMEYHQFKTGHNDFVEMLLEKKSRRRARLPTKNGSLLMEVFPSQTAVRAHYEQESSNATAADMPASPGAAESQCGTQYASTRIQIRLLDGTTLLASFNCHEKLRALREFINAQSTKVKHPYDLMTAFPRHIFTQAEYKKSFQSLNLVPSIVLIMTKPHLELK